MAKTLYAVMIKSAQWPGDYVCCLVEDTGEVLYRHISSSTTWGRQDLEGGLKRKHNVTARFPDGYEIVEATAWSDVPEAVRDANKGWADETENPV